MGAPKPLVTALVAWSLCTPLLGSSRAEPRVGLDVDAHAMLGLGAFCSRGSDTTGCSPAWGAPGFSGAAVWFLRPHVAFGAGASFHWLPNDSHGYADGTTTTFPKRMWQVFATARWYGKTGFWADVDLGAATISDGVRMTGVVNSLLFVSQSGPLGGVRWGHDWPITGRLTIGIGGGLLVTLFPSNPPTLRTPSDPIGTIHSYGPVFWLDLFARTSFRF